MSAHRWSRSAMVAVGIAIFVIGAAVGVLANRFLAPQRSIRLSAGSMTGVLDRLQLTPQQRAQAESILARSSPRSEAIMLDVSERLRGVADSVDAELRLILDPSQRARLDSLRRNKPQIMLRRKMISPGGVTVDTLLPPPRP